MNGVMKVRKSYAKRFGKMENFPGGMHSISIRLHIAISIFSNIINNNGTGLVSTLSINIQILLMFLVGFRVQEKMELKVSYFQTFRLRLESSSVRT